VHPVLKEKWKLAFAHECELIDETGQLQGFVWHFVANQCLFGHRKHFFENVPALALLNGVELHLLQLANGAVVFVHEVDLVVKVEVAALLVDVHLV